jgi:hypothetical protein
LRSSDSAAGIAQRLGAQLAGLGDLVGGEDRHRLRAVAGDLLAQRGLALGVVGDRRVVAEDLDEVGDPVAEALADVLGRGVGVLDEVVQQAGGDDLVVEAPVAQEHGDLQRVQDERREVGVAALPAVQVLRVRVGLARQREVGDERRGAQSRCAKSVACSEPWSPT